MGRGRWRTIRADYRDLPRTEWSEDEQAHWWQNCSEEEYWAEWERWSQDTFEHPTVDAIKATALDMALESARHTDSPSDPKEFACMLRVQARVITELVLLPGTVSGDEHAIFQFWMQPVDKEIRGTVHSHPDEHPYPSDADFELFEKHGDVHIILCRPYGPNDWRAYDHTGTPVGLDVVDG